MEHQAEARTAQFTTVVQIKYCGVPPTRQISPLSCLRERGGERACAKGHAENCADAYVFMESASVPIPFSVSLQAINSRFQDHDLRCIANPPKV
jgi:hypothetical protein